MSSVLVENGYIEYSDNNPDFADTDHRAAYYPVYEVDIGEAITGSIELSPGVSLKYYEDGLIAFNRATFDVKLVLLDGAKVALPSMDAVFLDSSGRSANKPLEQIDACVSDK